MSQFIDVKQANESARKAFEGYSSDMERIAQIKKKLNDGSTVSTEELLWVCSRAEQGIMLEKSSWYDHS